MFRDTKKNLKYLKSMMLSQKWKIMLSHSKKLMLRHTKMMMLMHQEKMKLIHPKEVVFKEASKGKNKGNHMAGTAVVV